MRCRAGGEAPLTWLAQPQLLPLLQRLEVRTNFSTDSEWPLVEDIVPHLVPLLPAGVKSLELAGMVEGLPHVLSQLRSLTWDVNPQRYYDAGLPAGVSWHWVIPGDTWAAICQVRPGGALGGFCAL